eukprot:3828866-Alexandrium_andersonii.AAC.1
MSQEGHPGEVPLDDIARGRAPAGPDLQGDGAETGSEYFSTDRPEESDATDLDGEDGEEPFMPLD